MADALHGTPVLNLVPIDIARYWNYALVEPSAGKRPLFKMSNTTADFDRLIAYLKTLPDPCRIGLEPAATIIVRLRAVCCWQILSQAARVLLPTNARYVRCEIDALLGSRQ